MGESKLIGEVSPPNYENLWHETVRERDEVMAQFYAKQKELHEAHKLNSELLRKVLEAQNAAKRRKSWLPSWFRTSIKIPLS
jgi:hypothetical protein